MSDKLQKKINEGKMYPIEIRMNMSPVNFIKFNLDGTLFFTCSNDGKVDSVLPRSTYTTLSPASCSTSSRLLNRSPSSASMSLTTPST